MKGHHHHGVVTAAAAAGLLLNNYSSSMKIDTNGHLNAKNRFQNSATLLCESSNGINSPPPTSPDSDDYYTGSMVAGHHLDNASNANHCYFSGILSSPPSCGSDSFKSVSSPESEFAELAPSPDDPNANEDHHISSLCSLTVPDIFKTSSHIDDCYLTPAETVQNRAKDQIDCYADTSCDVPNKTSESQTEPLDFRDELNDLSHNQSPANDKTERLNSQVKCKWRACDVVLKQSSDIVDHIRECHTSPQFNACESDSKFVCLWQGCKVYNKPSSSQSWLERHVMSHGGNKPFKCIVDGCESRFTSKNALERHVNSHFKISSQNSKSSNLNSDHKNGEVPSSSSKCSSSRPSKDESPCKSRRSKRTRLKRSWCKARNEDFIDSGIMDHLRHRVMLLNRNTDIDISNSGHSITFHSQVIGTRTNENGKKYSLVRWCPENIIADSWEPEGFVEPHKNIPIRSLPHDVDLRNLLGLSPFPKHKRKRK